MGSDNFIFAYVHACTTGKLALSDCEPIWQLGIIAALLGVALVYLIALRVRHRRQPASQ